MSLRALFLLSLLLACEQSSIYGRRGEGGPGMGASIEILRDKPDSHPDTIGSARLYVRPEWSMTVRRAGNERYELLRDGAVVGTIRYAGGHWIYVTFTTLPKDAGEIRTNNELRMRDDKPGVFQ